MQQMIVALAGDAMKMLVFDHDLGARFDRAGQHTTTFDPSGQWSVDDNAFDLALVVGLLERVDDDRSTLATVCERLDEDGIAIVAVPCATEGREPPPCRDGSMSLRQYSAQELTSIVLRAGMEISRWLAEGPELIVVECRRSQEVGADIVASVAKDVSAARWAKAEATLSAVTAQMESEELVREYALLVGHVHLARGRLAAALEAFSESSKLAGPSALPLTAMGAVAVSAGDFDAASDLLTAALELCPTHSAALRGLGFICETKGDVEGALTSYDMAAVQRPSDRETAEKIVDLAVEVGRASAAAHAIERHVTWSGDEGWAERILERFTPLEMASSHSVTSQNAVGSIE
jgi:Flp pilus assembly protein TadD